MPPPRIFLLSPANLNGRRGSLVLSPNAEFDVARKLRSIEGVSLGELFSFISALYFRGKLTYARRFAAPPEGADTEAAGGVQIITPTAGLRTPETRVTWDAVCAFAGQDIDAANELYRGPLEQSARALAADIGECEVVLLGSIASAKYVDVLIEIFGPRLRFPTAFVGRGDMSRGGLLLRQAAEGRELEYAAIAGATRRGTRPPKLAPICREPR